MPEEDGIQIHLIPSEDSSIYQHKQHMQYEQWDKALSSTPCGFMETQT
jgi:hypothetical protein